MRCNGWQSLKKILHMGFRATLNISDIDISGFGRNSEFRNCDVERFEIQTGDIKTPPKRASYICEIISKKYHKSRAEKYFRWFSYMILSGNWNNTVFVRLWVLCDDQWALIDVTTRRENQICCLNTWKNCTTVHYNENNLFTVTYPNQATPLSLLHIQTFLFEISTFPGGSKTIDKYGKAV